MSLDQLFTSIVQALYSLVSLHSFAFHIGLGVCEDFQMTSVIESCHLMTFEECLISICCAFTFCAKTDDTCAEMLLNPSNCDFVKPDLNCLFL